MANLLDGTTVYGSLSAGNNITAANRVNTNTFGFGLSGIPGTLGTFTARISAYDLNGNYMGYIPIYK